MQSKTPSFFAMSEEGTGNDKKKEDKTKDWVSKWLLSNN